jgi:hypothetical protein
VGALLEWWNLVFVLPFLLAVGFYLLLATGTISGDGDHDHPETPILARLKVTDAAVVPSPSGGYTHAGGTG